MEIFNFYLINTFLLQHLDWWLFEKAVILKKQNPKLFLIGICALAIPYLFFYITMVDLSRYSIEGPSVVYQ